MYYLEVIKNGLSVPIDTDIGCYKDVRLGDIICLSFDGNSTELISVNDYKLNIKNIYFVHNRFQVNSKRLNIIDAINSLFLVDISVSKIRNDKLKKLGI